MGIANKTIVVTGAASGIGSACAARLLKLGAKVIAMDRSFNEESSENSEWHGTINYDQGDKTSIQAAIDKLPASIDGLLNVAGVAPSPSFSPVDVLRINFYGLRELTVSILDRLNEGSAIVNMSSGTGAGWIENAQQLAVWLKIKDFNDIKVHVDKFSISNEGTGHTAAYPLSKQLLNAWTMQMAVACRQRSIRINAVAPAAVATPIMDDFLTSFGDEAAQRMSTFGAATPESIADASVFLLSEQANWINGALLPVDAGAIATGTIKKLNL